MSSGCQSTMKLHKDVVRLVVVQGRHGASTAEPQLPYSRILLCVSLVDRPSGFCVRPWRCPRAHAAEVYSSECVEFLIAVEKRHRCMQVVPRSLLVRHATPCGHKRVSK